MVDKLEAVRDVCDFYLGDCQRCGKRADRFNQDEPCPRGPWLPAARAPANGEQVEWVNATCAAAKQGTAGGNDPADCDWPMCGCDPHADRVIAALQESGHLTATPTEDARSRVKVLEEALEAVKRAALHGETGKVRQAVVAIVHATALGNKETDRHG